MITQEDAIFFLVILVIFTSALLVGGYSLLKTAVKNGIRGITTSSDSVNPIKTIIIVLIGYFSLSVGGIFLNEMLIFKNPPPIKLIMLDIDGVLNHNKAPERINVSHLYDPACIERFNKLVEHHKAYIVVCSAWRIGQTIESMQEILNSIGVKGEVIGLTPWYRGYHTRDDEITAWLDNFDQLDHIAGFVLIDDDSSERFSSYQVKPSWNEFGLRWDHVEQASIILDRKMPDKFDIGKVEICKSEVTDEMNFGGHHIQKKL